MKVFKGGRIAAACFMLMMAGAAAAQSVNFTNPAKPQRTFDAAWKAFVAVRDANGDFEEKMITRPRLLARMALDLFEGYPQDPRRWNAVAELFKANSAYSYGRDESKTGPDSYLRDNAGRIAWNTYARALYEQLVAAPDVPPEAAKAGIAAYFGKLSMTFDAAPESLVPVVDEYTRRFPDDPALAPMEDQIYSRFIGSPNPTLAEERLPKLLQSSNPAVRDFAQAKMLVKVGRNRPIDMKFKAIDGREVDLEKLRGKVVLIDFWATWCVPCMEEVPHLKKMYEQYRQQGFEIVGISFDATPKASNPSSEEKSADKLRAFLQEKGMSWPNYYDGKGWGNEMGKKYAIKGLPSKFLLGKDGLLAALNLSGEALESKVKELLASEPGKARAAEAPPMPSGGSTGIELRK
jgi:thiol-disulfide isomerase/thioredoxin